MSPQLVYFLVLSNKITFFKLDDIFPECSLFREKHLQLEPLICFANNSCHAGQHCMEKLAPRLHAMFDDLIYPCELMLLYYRKRNVPGIGAGVFWKDFREPRVITINPSAWKTVKRRSALYQFVPGSSFFLTGKAADPTLSPTANNPISLAK